MLFYILSLITLLTYSLVVNYHTTYSYLGLINSISIVATDIIICMLIFIAKKNQSNPIRNSIVVIIVRVCITAFTGYYWFIGFCLLYLLLSFYISLLIIDQNYPRF